MIRLRLQAEISSKLEADICNPPASSAPPILRGRPVWNIADALLVIPERHRALSRSKALVYVYSEKTHDEPESKWFGEEDTKMLPGPGCPHMHSPIHKLNEPSETVERRPSLRRKPAGPHA